MPGRGWRRGSAFHHDFRVRRGSLVDRCGALSGTALHNGLQLFNYGLEFIGLRTQLFRGG